MIGIDTKKVHIEETEDNITVDVDYSLDVNYEFLAECHIRIDICSKQNSSFSLN